MTVGKKKYYDSTHYATRNQESTFRIYGVDLSVGPCHFLRYFKENNFVCEYVDSFSEGSFVFASFNKQELYRLRTHMHQLNGIIMIPGIKSPITFRLEDVSNNRRRPHLKSDQDDQVAKRRRFESSGI
uniref:RRM domain-containing protein n=1 Tax=Parastrongyloides trichosuri TaxID=131310 RepID=A0A0N4ZJ68_PARTI